MKITTNWWVVEVITLNMEMKSPSFSVHGLLLVPARPHEHDRGNGYQS